MQATITFFGNYEFRNPISVLQQNYVVCIETVPNYPHSTWVRLDIQDG
jgi:hypothetical protein